MYKYTICFIKRGTEILLLNREKAQWMGCWNGVGGKIEEGETPLENILREIREETGIELNYVEYKGTVTWSVDDSYIGGMYAYVAEVPETFKFTTPVKTEEGILDWKDVAWIFHPENQGVANLKYFLNSLITDSHTYDHRFIYKDGEVIDFKTERIDSIVNI